MPAKSKGQQRLMGQAYALKTGQLKKSDINPLYRKAIIALSKSMTEEELEAYATTKLKGLPNKVDESAINIGTIEAKVIPPFHPKGPASLVPFLDTDAKQTKKGKRNLENLKDYRDWLDSK
jgi:hypothetical protein